MTTPEMRAAPEQSALAAEVAGRNETFRQFQEMQRAAAMQRDKAREDRRQRILEQLTEIIRGGCAWTLDDLMHDLSAEDRVFMAQVFPLFVEKLRGVYPNEGMGRLADLDGVRHVMDLIGSERTRPYAEVVSERQPGTGKVEVELLERAGEVDRAELELELLALRRMGGARRFLWTLILLAARSSETTLRRVRARLANAAR